MVSGSLFWNHFPGTFEKFLSTNPIQCSIAVQPGTLWGCSGRQVLALQRNAEEAHLTRHSGGGIGHTDGPCGGCFFITMEPIQKAKHGKTTYHRNNQGVCVFDFMGFSMARDSFRWLQLALSCLTMFDLWISWWHFMPLLSEGCHLDGENLANQPPSLYIHWAAACSNQ